MLSTLERKESEKKRLNKICDEKYHKSMNLAEKINHNKNKLERIKRKNEYLKILICKLMKENNNLK